MYAYLSGLIIGTPSLETREIKFSQVKSAGYPTIEKSWRPCDYVSVLYLAMNPDKLLVRLRDRDRPSTNRLFAMSNPEFRYSLRINTIRRLSIIRYPNDSHIFAALVNFSQTLPVEEFYSLTRTAREISVIQDAKYPTYPHELGVYG
jgi:hypothetical protein